MGLKSYVTFRPRPPHSRRPPGPAAEDILTALNIPPRHTKRHELGLTFRAALRDWRRRRVWGPARDPTHHEPSATTLPGYCPWVAYLASTSALSGRHQASLSRYQSMVACSPERKSVNFGAQPSSSTSLELSMA